MDEQNIPIDIHTNKLLDWLVSRRHVKKEWQNSVLEIREKINNAIQDMPAHEGIVKLLSGQYINYVHCLKIVEILKETEADSKNVFGRYGSQRMKDWQDIIVSYQRDNAYLAELSQMLIRNVKYEIPGLRKQITKLQQTQTECEQKIKEYSKADTMYQKEFHTLCEQLGIPGKNIKNELKELIQDLPSIYEKSLEKLKEVKPAIELYTAFNEYLSGSKTEMLKLLPFVINEGNVTTYQYLHGKKPTKIILPELKSSSVDTNSSNEIDFGTDIDFNVENTDNDSIDWGIKSEDEFEIIDHSDDNSKFITVDMETEDVATGAEALTLLDNPTTRPDLINNLLELKAFLKIRMLEVTNEADLLSMTLMQNAPSLIQLETLETVTSLSDKVNEALDDLMDKRTQHLHNLKHSVNYVDILTSNLNQKLSQAERAKNCKSVMEKKIVDVQTEVVNVEKIVSSLIVNTKELQKNIQDDISLKYKGRVVNIIGGVNSL